MQGMYENKRLAKMMHRTCNNKTVGRMDGGEEMAEGRFYSCAQGILLQL